jgi:hypothetical protein
MTEEEYNKTWGTPIGNDCINLDLSLAKWLGERLIFLAKYGHGFPNGWESQEWSVKLNAHGNNLLEYADKKFKAHGQDEVFLHAKVKEALTFVTDEFKNLWD